MFGRFQSNFSLACRLKITSSVCFSMALAEYSDHLASLNQMHNEAMVIVILNVVAVMCENSKIYRANKFPLPMNLYNLVVARSSYGKSPILDLVRKSIDEVVRYRPSKFKSASKDGEEFDQVVYFDENTAAGLLSSLNGCTRFLITDEADVVLKKMGYTLPPPGSRDWSTNDCRSQLLTLYDRPHNFTRRLKRESIQVFDAKLNVLGAVSGDLIIAALMRQASGSMADALFERTMIWPLDGEVIPTASCVMDIDTSKYMSIQQFAIVVSFIENIDLYFDKDANERMIVWCDDLKKKSAAEKNNDHMAARFGKSVQNCHRIVGFLYIAELAYSIGLKYLVKYDHFPNNGKITIEFVDHIQTLFAEYLIDENNQFIQHYITFDMVERCRDVITENIEQYKLLMYLTPEERFTEVKQSSSALTSLKRKQDSEKLSKKQKRIIRLQPRMTEIMARVLRFRSIIFTSSNLYTDEVIKRSASILGSALAKLIELDLLLIVKKGFFSSKWTAVYVKRLPDPFSTDDQMEFECKLGEFGISGLNLQSFRETCYELLIDGKGKVSDDLINELQRPEYKELNLDMSILIERSSKYIILHLEYLRLLNRKLSICRQ
ncbi:unnamed protein product [Rotaria sp. Silwood1]|nr:unnamed protein product [Rotaria sp. Silwood1]